MGWVHSVFSPSTSQSLPKDDLTIAEMLQPLGYVSGFAGKWHLGINNHSKDDGSFLPFYRGFEEVCLSFSPIHSKLHASAVPGWAHPSILQPLAV